MRMRLFVALPLIAGCLLTALAEAQESAPPIVLELEADRTAVELAEPAEVYLRVTNVSTGTVEVPRLTLDCPVLQCTVRRIGSARARIMPFSFACEVSPTVSLAPGHSAVERLPIFACPTSTTAGARWTLTSTGTYAVRCEVEFPVNGSSAVIASRDLLLTVLPPSTPEATRVARTWLRKPELLRLLTLGNDEEFLLAELRTAVQTAPRSPHALMANACLARAAARGFLERPYQPAEALERARSVLSEASTTAGFGRLSYKLAIDVNARLRADAMLQANRAKATPSLVPVPRDPFSGALVTPE